MFDAGLRYDPRPEAYADWLFILRAALDRAVKWGYLGKNAAALAEPPSFGTPEPDPPTPEELAPVINEAWRDPAWGLFLWLTIVSGCRRGET